MKTCIFRAGSAQSRLKTCIFRMKIYTFTVRIRPNTDQNLPLIAWLLPRRPAPLLPWLPMCPAPAAPLLPTHVAPLITPLPNTTPTPPPRVATLLIHLPTTPTPQQRSDIAAQGMTNKTAAAIVPEKNAGAKINANSPTPKESKSEMKAVALARAKAWHDARTAPHPAPTAANSRRSSHHASAKHNANAAASRRYSSHTPANNANTAATVGHRSQGMTNKTAAAIAPEKNAGAKMTETGNAMRKRQARAGGRISFVVYFTVYFIFCLPFYI
jgi:hypothetical protein